MHHPEVGQQTTYHHGPDTYDAIVTKVEGHRVDIVFLDDERLVFHPDAEWRDGAAYGNPPGGGPPGP